ncbi:uncharacterized protein LOC126976759 [Leptidea sinapis]|uniref:uncharacterized protein LOC126976759 n=1 Tax=Leptidea sinapis TaxID=189913 RepID=UPI00212ADDE7|nr:uncharacterized protein LOC126976759 [Leptidea sinapis]
MVVKEISLFIVCLIIEDVVPLSFPGPRVYVVTPSPRPFQANRDNSGPFYYHNWMRRMDSEPNITTTTTTEAPKVKTPDLIFAEFESGNTMQKSIRKLLEKERIDSTSTTTTPRPIYIPENDDSKVTRVVNYGLPVSTPSKELELPVFQENEQEVDYNPDLYDLPVNINKAATSSTTKTTTTTKTPVNVENIWHVIDNEKLNQYTGNWNEVPVAPEYTMSGKNNNNSGYDGEEDKAATPDESINNSDGTEDHDDILKIDDNFALPGFGTNPGSGAENESRAIRTEPNIRFPYINLKPFQMKKLNKPDIDAFSNSKSGNNLYTSLDNFFDLKNPVRGEAQDIIPMKQPIDRYNPAQPYLPQYNKVMKQSSPVYAPPKATANLVPPPPPQPPKITGNDFPAPSTYDSFPPYAPSSPNFAQDSIPSSPAQPAPAPPSLSEMSPPVQVVPSISSSLDSYSDPSSDDDLTIPTNIGYNYKQPSPPSQSIPQFRPTLPPLEKSQMGYSYNKPSMPAPVPSDSDDFKGYHYSKPQAPTLDYPPAATYDSPPSYDHSGPPSDHDRPDHDSYHGDMDDHDMGMVPPPPPSDSKPDSYGGPPDHHDFPSDFPSDFPGDLKFHHDFDDHDHYHYHHPTTTTTSTTETPRVNRFSYYYLGKKLYYLPLYFSVYFIVYVGALIIKAVLRHKIVYPNSWRPNTTTASFFSKRSVDQYLSNENLHEVTGKVTHAIATAAEKYLKSKSKLE